MPFPIRNEHPMMGIRKSPDVLCLGDLFDDRFLGKAAAGPIAGQKVIDGIFITAKDDPFELKEYPSEVAI